MRLGLFDYSDMDKFTANLRFRYMVVTVILLAILSMRTKECAAIDPSSRLYARRVDCPPRELWPTFHVGNVDLRLHMDDNYHNEIVKDMVASQLQYNSGVVNGPDFSEIRKNSNHNMTLAIPHGGDTLTAKTSNGKYNASTDLSDVARKIMQEFKVELTSITQKNQIDMKILLTNIAFELQKLRYEQDLRRDRHRTKQAAIESVTTNEYHRSRVATNTKIDTDHELSRFILEENKSPMLLVTTGNTIDKRKNIEYTGNHKVELSADDEVLLNATSVTNDSVFVDAHVVDIGSTEIGAITLPTNVEETNTTLTITLEGHVGDSTIDENDNSVDVDAKDAVSFQDLLVEKVKKRKTRKSRKKSYIKPTASRTATFSVNTIDVDVSMIDRPSIGLDLFDDKDVIEEDKDDMEENYEQIPSTIDLLLSSMHRFISSSITAVVICLLYLAMKRVVSILLGIMFGIHTGTAKRSILTSISP